MPAIAVAAVVAVACADGPAPDASPTSSPPAPSPLPSPDGTATPTPSPTPSPGPDAGAQVAYLTASADPEQGAVVVLVDPETGERRELDVDVRQYYAWSPDGTRLAYTTQMGPPGPSSRDVHVLDVETGDDRAVTSEGDDQQVVWSPTGEQLAFVRGSVGEPGPHDLFVADPDDPEPRQLTDVGERTDVFGPAWSPGGDRLVYRQVDRAAAEGQATPSAEVDALRVVGLDGSEPRDLVRDLHDETEPVWSPDGDRIAFRARAAPRFDAPAQLHLVDPDGGERRELVADVGLPGGIAWSPDGDRIALTTSGGPQQPSDITVVDATDGEVLATLDGDEIDTSPVWSPDGRWIAFTGHPGAEEPAELYVARPDGSDLRQLTEDASVTTPSFQPSPASS